MGKEDKVPGHFRKKEGKWKGYGGYWSIERRGELSLGEVAHVEDLDRADGGYLRRKFEGGIGEGKREARWWARCAFCLYRTGRPVNDANIQSL